ncbi:unnamed protein product [Rotaria sordida]|uniref:Choline transporter-like protein n=1 Tax=Rotaria sordida TaxID=392033 RepID=A0A819LDC9_9BILA|nr:unnamed protein product [Rotaria sordida]CAF3986963.1 unnamed protein product [Rotaria sordida]
MQSYLSSSSGAHDESPQQALQKKRYCTGDPKQVLHPTDSEGNLCGTGIFLDRPYLYFFDWRQCIEAFGIATNILKTRPFACPTTQNYYTNRVCTYDVNLNDFDNEELVNNRKCASYIIASRPLFGRCIPEQLEALTNSLIQVTNDKGVNQIVVDSDGKAINGTNLVQGVKYLVEILNLKQIGEFLVEDLITSWKYILLALTLAAFFAWILLIYWLAKPMVWLGILLSIFSSAILMVQSYREFDQLSRKNGNQIVTEFKFVADVNYYLSLPITWLIICIVSALFLIILILILLVLYKRLVIALAILKEASKAVGYNIFNFIWPFITYLLEIGVCVYWAVVTVYLATSGKPIYRIMYKKTMTNTRNVLLGEICDPIKWKNTIQMNGTCVFWQYGYNPQVDLDSILNDTGGHFKLFISFVNQHQWIPQAFSAFMLFWLIAFVIGFSQLVLAGIYARYYWDRERFGVPFSSLLASIFHAFVFHLGTIAFGSLLIAIVKLIRDILEYIEQKVKDKTGRIARCLFCCCCCCLFCLEKSLKYLNRNAYIITAIYGTGFLTSAKRAFGLIVSNPLRLYVIDNGCYFLIFLGKLCITGGIGILAFLFFTHRIAQVEKYVPELQFYLVPVFLIIIGTYIITDCFFSVYSMAIDTLFICALQDIQLQNNNEEYELVMPKGLKKAFGIKNK